MSTTDDSTPYEDFALKNSMRFFAEALLPFLGILEEVNVSLPTEQIQFEIKQSLMDYNFKTTTNKILHFEFQSSNGGIKDLRRFRRYEVNIADNYQLEVITYVIFTGNIKKPMTKFTEGINTYQIIPITMQNKNADTLLADIRYAMENEIPLEKEQLIPILLTPLMAGDTSIKERIDKSISILKKQEISDHKSAALNQDEILKMESVLYMFANKFLNAQEIKEIKEVLKMTILGELLYTDGVNAGFNDGIEKGRLHGQLETLAENILSILGRFGFISDSLVNAITQERQLETLKNWFQIALQVNSIHEFEAKFKM